MEQIILDYIFAAEQEVGYTISEIVKLNLVKHYIKLSSTEDINSEQFNISGKMLSLGDSLLVDLAAIKKSYEEDLEVFMASQNEN